MALCFDPLNTLKKVILQMVSLDSLRKLASSFPETTEEPHFEKTSFRVKKNIFATYDDKTRNASVKLSEIDQSIFSSAAPTIIYPVNNKWGKQGWTVIEMDRLNDDLFVDVFTTAYCEVAPIKLAVQVKPSDKD